MSSLHQLHLAFQNESISAKSDGENAIKRTQEVDALVTMALPNSD